MLKVKKLIAIVVLALVTACSAAFAAPQTSQAAAINSYQDNELKLAVKSALAIDSKTGQVLYAKNANQKLPIASMTKLITVYLTLNAIKNKDLTWNTKVKPTKAIVKVANNSEYSNVPLKSGHSYTVKQLYQATLIESANGAAMTLGQAISGSQVAFVKKMRTQLKNWGINDAEIYTACGLPNGNVGAAAFPGVDKNAENTMSARDMAIIGQRLLTDFPIVLKTTKLAHLDFKDKGQMTKMVNFNWMLKGLSQYDPSLKVDGLKTGTTDKAGACFIGTMPYQGGRIITVVMGARHQDGTDPSRFIQTKKLLNWIKVRYTPITYNAGQIMAHAKTIKVRDGKQLTTPIALKNKTTIWDPMDGQTVKASLVSSEVNAPIEKGQTVGSYEFVSGKQKLVDLDNKQVKTAAKATQDNGKVNFFVRIWRWITGQN